NRASCKEYGLNISNEVLNRCILPIHFDNRKRKSVLINMYYKETKRIMEKKISVNLLYPLKLNENETDADKYEQKTTYLPNITIYDFEVYYFPFDNLSIETFFKFLNILSCFSLINDNNLKNILKSLMFSVGFSPQDNIYDYKQTILQNISMYHISFDIIFLLTSVFLDLSIYGIDLIPTLLLDTNNEGIYSYYNIEIQKENSILISKNLSRMFSNQNLNNSYSFKILLFFFMKKNFKTAIFRIIPLKNTSLWRLLSMILNSVDQVIFHNIQINKQLISFLNETDILKDLKTVHFWLAESNSNILSYIETILYTPNIFIEYNDCIQQSMYEKIKMKPLSIIKIVRCRLKNNILRSSISDIIKRHTKSISINLFLKNSGNLYSLRTISFENIKCLKLKEMELESIFIDCILNLPGIEILYLYDCNIEDYDEFHIYPKNYSITTFSFLGKKIINVNLFYKFMCSMIKFTNLEICNDSLSLLLDKDQNCLFSHIIHLNILEFCCLFKIYTNNNSFYFPFFISEEISVGVGFPAGTLKKIFSIQENLNIKKLLYSENFLDDSDSRALENLNFLDNIELSSNIVEIRFHELFDINKTYK
ncbi:hypothetical protein CWI36_2422p0010, partial [Hamiltosporidium magnivora]